MVKTLIPLYSLKDLKEIAENFLSDLKRAEIGQKSSLAFIRNPLPQKPQVRKGELFQVVVVGGTVWEGALVKEKNDEISILEEKRGEVPALRNKEIFFSFFERLLYPEIEVLALNFAYPLDPFTRKGLLDGKLVKGTKEHSFSGLINKAVGQELEDYVFQRSKRQLTIAAANDTVCLVLAGLGVGEWSSIVGGVVGSGTNFGFFLDENTIVNLESGDFDKLKQTETGLEIDKASARRGDHVFEKEVSGSYLFQHFNFLIEKLGLKTPPLSSNEEITLLAQENQGKESQVSQELLERSASLIASQMLGLYLFKKQSPLVFVMEGGLFWKGWQYKEMVRKYLKRLGLPPRSIVFKKIDQSSILGGARLVTGH